MWPKVSLGEIVKNLDNRRVPLNSVEREKKSKEKLYPYIGANNIMDYIGEYIFDEKILCVAEDGGSWGQGQTCAVIYEGKTWVNNHAHVLVENGKAKLEYLRYFLNRSDLNKYITGTTRGKLTRSALDSIQVPLPSLQDQIRIANVLSKAEALIAQRKESLRLLDELLKSTFLKMFGDPVTNTKKIERTIIGELTNRIVVGHVGPTSHGYAEEGIPFLRTQNVRENFINYTDIKLITKEFYSTLKKSIINEGDVLISRVGVNRGMAAVVPKDLDKANCANIVIVGKTPKLDSLYLAFYLNFTFGKKPEFGASVGSAQGVVNTSIVKKWPIILAPLNLQTQFAHIVEKTEALKAHYQTSLQELENLYGSLSQRAFSSAGASAKADKGELNLKGEGASYAEVSEDTLAMAAEPKGEAIRPKSKN